MPADFGTKETAKININFDNEWFQPRILREDWTKYKISDEEINYHNRAIDKQPMIIDWNRFSKWYQLMRSIKNIFKIIDCIKWLMPIVKKLKTCKTRANKKSLDEELALAIETVKNDQVHCIKAEAYERIYFELKSEILS